MHRKYEGRPTPVGRPSCINLPSSGGSIMLGMFKPSRPVWIAPFVAVLALVVVAFVPAVHDPVLRRIDDARQQLKYRFNPPEDAVFRPTQQAVQQAAIEAIVNATMQAHDLTQMAYATPRAAVTTA